MAFCFWPSSLPCLSHWAVIICLLARGCSRPQPLCLLFPLLILSSAVYSGSPGSVLQFVSTSLWNRYQCIHYTSSTSLRNQHFRILLLRLTNSYLTKPNYSFPYSFCRQSVVTCAYNPNTWDMETGGPGKDLSRLHIESQIHETLSQNIIQTNKNYRKYKTPAFVQANSTWVTLTPGVAAPSSLGHEDH